MGTVFVPVQITRWVGFVINFDLYVRKARRREVK